MKNCKVGIIFGSFDLLHAGHIHLLKQAKKRCDYLIVGLHANPKRERPEKNKPLESILERTIKLEGCKYVNKVIVYETEEELRTLLIYCSPDVRFLGSDYNETDKEIMHKNLVEIEYIESLPIHTTDIRRRINGNN